MLSYTERQTIYTSLTKDSTSGNITNGNTLMNNYERQLLAKKPWWFTQRTATVTSAASTQFYNLPYDCRKLNKVSTVVGNTRYVPLEVNSRQDWDFLNDSTARTSNIPERWFVFNDQVGIYPIPSGTGQTHTLIYEAKFKDLTIADYTTGTISAIANGATTVTGSGTSWTSQMAGRWIRIDDGNAVGSGDGYWYEIDSVTSTTELELKKPYNGTTISGGSATYTIGQMTMIPEEYHIIPVLRAAVTYWKSQNKQIERANALQQDYLDLVAQMEEDQGSRSSGSVILSGDINPKNPNLYVTI